MEARHLYYEASAMIIGLINLGHMLEAERVSAPRKRWKTARPDAAFGAVVTPEGERSAARGSSGRHDPAPDYRRPRPGRRHDKPGEAGLMKRCSPANRCRSKRRWRRYSRRDRGAGWQRAVYRQRRRQPDHAGKNYPHGARAQSSKPEIGQLADKISAVFVPAVVVIALISAAIWYFFGPAPQIVYTSVIATTVLIIACPCALGWRRRCRLSPALAGRRSMACWSAMPLQRASELDTGVR